MSPGDRVEILEGHGYEHLGLTGTRGTFNNFHILWPDDLAHIWSDHRQQSLVFELCYLRVLDPIERLAELNT